MKRLKLTLHFDVEDDVSEEAASEVLGYVKELNYQQMVFNELMNGDNPCEVNVIDAVVVTVEG